MKDFAHLVGLYICRDFTQQLRYEVVRGQNIETQTAFKASEKPLNLSRSQQKGAQL